MPPGTVAAAINSVAGCPTTCVGEQRWSLQLRTLIVGSYVADRRPPSCGTNLHGRHPLDSALFESHWYVYGGLIRIFRPHRDRRAYRLFSASDGSLRSRLHGMGGRSLTQHVLASGSVSDQPLGIPRQGMGHGMYSLGVQPGARHCAPVPRSREPLRRQPRLASVWAGRMPAPAEPVLAARRSCRAMPMPSVC